MRKHAFTLVEILIAVAILTVLLVGVYQVFIGGSKTAGKGQWINGTVDQMRNALNLISTEIRSATYPSTMLKNTIFDPCDNPDKKVASKYYLKIHADNEAIKIPTSGKKIIMDWNVCNTEKPGTEPGKMTNHKLYLVFKEKVDSNVLGDLVMETNVYEYTTDPKNKYARSGKLNLTQIKAESKNKVLVNDVESVALTVGGVVPAQKPLDFFPISVKIRTVYPKDTKVFKENSIMATPQVAIGLLGISI